MPTEILGDGRARVGEPIAFGGQHVEELAAPREEGLEGLGGGIGQETRRRVHALGKERQDLGVDVIRLGELAGPACKVAHMTRIGDHQREAGGGQGGDHRAFVAAGGFEDDEGDGQRLEAAGERGEAGLIVADGPRFFTWGGGRSPTPPVRRRYRRRSQETTWPTLLETRVSRWPSLA